MQCLKLLCAIIVLFMLSMESESSGAGPFNPDSDDESIGSCFSLTSANPLDKGREYSVASSARSETSDEESMGSASLTVRSALSDLDRAGTIFSVKPEIIPRLTVRHVSKNGLNDWTLSNVSSHEDLVAKFGLKEERILMIVYGDLGKYEGPETFKTYASIIGYSPDSKAFLISIYENPN